jgi:hypothetical protein
MSLPGYQVNIVETPPNAGEFTDIATLFTVGQVTNPGFDLVYSIDQFESLFGQRQPGNATWDGVQTFFREGGYRAYVNGLPLASGTQEIIDALPLFTPDLGPGSLTCFGLVDDPLHLALMDHCQDGTRIALLDGPDVSDMTELGLATSALVGQPGDRFSAMFWPWDVAPGLTPDTARIVPPSARVAGRLAYNDALGYSSGDPAAGVLGIARYIQDLSQPNLTDSDRQTLNESSINVSRRMLRGIRTYGWRSLADQTKDTDWSFFNNSRTVMAVKYQLSIVAENFMFSKLDSIGRVTKKFGGVIANALLQFWQNGDLFGDTSSEAFSVDVGPSVNTPASFAQGIVAANVGLHTSSMAEKVIINIAKVPITESLAA